MLLSFLNGRGLIVRANCSSCGGSTDLALAPSHVLVAKMPQSWRLDVPSNQRFLIVGFSPVHW